MNMLQDLEAQIEKLALSGEEVTNQELSEELIEDLLMIVKHPTFLIFFGNKKNFDFCFDYLDNLMQADNHDMYMRVLHILFFLPKNDVSLQSFQVCMINNVNYFSVKLDVDCPDHKWVLETGWEFRVKLAYLYIPYPQNIDDQLPVKISRENLVEDSVSKIIEAEGYDLSRGVSVRFVDEAGFGDGVRRDWITSLVGKMAESRDAFQTSGDELRQDYTRIYPKQGSSKDAAFYRCFGRLIVLALMHNIQVGFTLDNILFLQLAEKEITLEDIRATAPGKCKAYDSVLQSSPNTLLESDYYFSDASDDSDTSDDDDNGDGMIQPTKGQVTFGNRERFVSEKIQKEFVVSIETETREIIEGFDDLLSVYRPEIFRIIKLEDLDCMIRGIQELNMEDWIKFTTYEGYRDTDPQIRWFWQCVKDMSNERKRKLLYIWTSIKYLPRGGFEALNPPLVIRNWQQDEESLQHLPSAQTCFSTLSFPPYESCGKMLKKLLLVIDECDCSFDLE